MVRRTFLGAAAAAALAPFAVKSAMTSPAGLGLNTYCLRAMRWNDQQLLDYTAGLKLDAVFLQDSLDPDKEKPEHWTKIRNYAKQLGLHLETGGGTILPKTEADFANQVKLLEYNIGRAQAMGSKLVRCLIAGDRYSMPPGPVEKHMETTVKVMKAVRTRAMDAGVKLALENHKELQAWETRQVIDTAGKEFVGSYLDTGNPSFVLEHPMTTLEELGPVAVSLHLRDSVLYEHPRGVAVQWVPLGEGAIDFPALIARAKEICPPVHVYVKPITGRPPAILPFLEDSFWDYFPRARAKDLSRFLATVKKGRPYEKNSVIEDVPGRKTPDHLVPAIQAQQREHMERSVEYAKKTLGLGQRWRS